MNPRFRLLVGSLLAAPFFAHAQIPAGVGIGTTAPTQTLDVNGSLRIRGLSGPANRLPTLLPDGTLGANAPIFGTAPVAGPPTAATGSATTGSRPVGVDVSGTTAYVISFDPSANGGNYGLLQVFDIAVPSAPPVLLGSTYVNGRPRSVAVSGPRAYVACNGTATQPTALHMFSVAPPSNPSLVGFTPTLSSIGAVAANGTMSYTVYPGANRLEVFDATNSNRPLLLAGIGTGRGPSGVAVSGTTVYVANTDDNTLQLFDVAVPLAPALLSTIATGSSRNGAGARFLNSVAVSGTRAYVVNGDGNTLQVFDVAVPGTPVLLSTVATGNSPTAVAVSGTRAYVTNYDDASLQVFDVATPSAPVLLSTAATGSQPVGVAANGTAACVVNEASNTLQVFGGTPSRLVAVNTDGSLASVAAPALGLNGPNLSIVGGNSVTLPDASATNELQTLSIVGSTISLTDGGSITVPSSADNLGSHTATQNLNLQGNALTGTGASIGGVGMGVRADGGLNLGQSTVGNSIYLGYQAGAASTGTANLFVGYQSGYHNTTGSQNVFNGGLSGYNNTTGSGNLFNGYQSGIYNMSGNDNVFSGYQSGYNNVTGFSNVFSGYQSGYKNLLGSDNLFSGYQSGYNNDTGNHNLFLGYQSGQANTSGSSNVFSGSYSGQYNTTGSSNTALGYQSGPASGSGALTNATALGANVSLTQSNTVVLGNGASVGIGTSTPAQKLEVIGSVQIPAANNYRYATAKTYSVSYGAADFQPERDGDRKGIGNNGSSDELYAFSVAANFRTPVRLPQGATITGYTVYYNDTQTANLTVSLLRLTPGTPATTTSLAAASTSGTPGYGSTPVAVSGAPAVVDNAQHYYLRAQFPAASAGLAVSAVVLTYTVTAVE